MAMKAALHLLRMKIMENILMMIMNTIMNYNKPDIANQLCGSHRWNHSQH